MDRGSADVFGNRLCNSMLSNRNSNKATIRPIDSANDKNGKLRGSMLTPR